MKNSGYLHFIYFSSMEQFSSMYFWVTTEKVQGSTLQSIGKTILLVCS